MASWLDAYPVVEEPVEESSDYKSRLIKKILSGAEDYTYGPGSPTPTPSDMRQRIGSRDNRLVTGDVALPPRDYGLFTPEEREQYRIADTSWFTPGRPTPRGSVERYYGAGRSEDISWLNDYPVAEESAAVEEPSGDTSWLDKYPVAEEPPKPQGPTAEEAGGITVAGQYVPEEQVPAAKAVLGGLENLQFVQRNLLDPIKQVAELKHAAAEAPPQTAEEYDLLYYKTGKTKSEREELNRPLHEAMQVPLVSPETIATGLRGISSIGAMRPEDLEQGPIEKGTTGEVAKMLSGLTTGEGAAALPAYMFPPTAVGLTAGDVQDLPADVTETIQKLQQGDKEGAAAAATRALMKTAMSGAVIKGAGAVSGPKSLPEAMTRLEADKLRTAVKGPEAPTEVISETARPAPAVEPTVTEEIYAPKIESAGKIPELEVRPRVGEEAPLRGEPEGIAREEVPGGGPAPEAQAAVGEIQSKIKAVMDEYDSGSQRISTERDIAAELEQIEGLPPELQKALDDFNESVREDRELYGERSGEPEIYGEKLVQEAYRVTEPKPATPTTPVPPEVVIPEGERGYAGLEPPTPPVSEPVPGGLPQKPSKIGKSIEAKAVEAKLTQGFAETAGYDPVTIAHQSQLATDVIKASPVQARAMIRGEAPLPEGLRGTSLITAMEEHLLKRPDAQVAYELANSPLTSATSAAAQEMRLMQERVPDSLAAKFTEIKRARAEGAKLRGETSEKVARDISKEVVRTASKRPTWEAFVREIAC